MLHRLNPRRPSRLPELIAIAAAAAAAAFLIFYPPPSHGDDIAPIERTLAPGSNDARAVAAERESVPR